MEVPYWILGKWILGYWTLECDVAVLGIPGTGNFSSLFFGGIGTSIGKNWYRKKVSEPVSEKFGTGKSIGTSIEKIRYQKKYRYRYRKYFVPEKSIGIGII